MDPLSQVEERLVEEFKRRGSVLVALSGGVDSSVVAALAFKALKDRAAAVTFSSPLHPSWEVVEAAKVASEIGVKHLVLEVDELELPSVAGNLPERCYECKRLRFSKALKLAEELRLSYLAEGSNLDDVAQYRPGLKALRELGVWSPLLEAGLRRSQVVELARRLGLSVAEKPPSTCLATRFPYGRRLTVDLLRRIAEAERLIKELCGIGLVRARDHGGLVRIEVEASEALKILEKRFELASRLKELGYAFVGVWLLRVDGEAAGCSNCRPPTSFTE